jgi:hypothetical protein
MSLNYGRMYMNMKKMVSVLLILFALGTVVLFAATTDGVQWNYSESRGVTTLTNTTGNDLYVMVWVNGSVYSGGNGYLAAGRIKVTTKW